MLYSIEVSQYVPSNVVTREQVNGKRNATKTAREYAEKYPKPHYQVFVSFFRPSDGQQGYLNSDGNHAITGEAW